MTKQSTILGQLEAIVTAEGMREPSSFAVDGVTPQAAVAPAGYEQVAEVMRYAHVERLAVIPWGGGSHVHIGNIPARYDIALSLSRLDRVVEHEPADLTVTCAAGIPLARLQEYLGQHGQMAPFGPAWDDRATVGGILAANATSPARHSYGAPRDFTIGLRVVTADGRLTKAGGRVVKNVAGYDLCKLYIGSLGTLGVIVEATLKLAPLPKARQALLIPFADAQAACSLAAQVRRRGLAVAGLDLSREPTSPTWLLAVELAGAHTAVERSRAELRRLAGEAQIREAPASDATSPESVSLLCKLIALPTRLPALIDALTEAPRLRAWPTVGVVYVAWPALDDIEDTVQRLRSAASRFDASLIAERCPPEIKPRLDVFGEPPASFALMRRVKERFDPNGILSPGRFVGRL